MRRNSEDGYYTYLCDIVGSHEYTKLLFNLYNRDFVWRIELDANRAADGIDLRRHYELSTGCDISILDDKPCSMLEMMIALSMKMENVMTNLDYGDRTGQWFWQMVHSLGLSSLTDNHFDKRYFHEIIDRFIEHDYKKNGKGGLFTLSKNWGDMRREEIHTQMCWYLDTLED